MRAETIGAHRLACDVDQMGVMAEDDHLAMRGRCGEYPEECGCATVIGGNQQVVADDRQGRRGGASLDRAQAKREIELVACPLAERLDADFAPSLA